MIKSAFRTLSVIGVCAGLAACSQSIAQTQNISLPKAEPVSSMNVTVVSFQNSKRPGDIVISNSERRLYYILDNQVAIRYPIAVGRAGTQWTGSHKVSRKAEWPSWTPTANMRRKNPNLPKVMRGGPNNPLGARAIYLGNTLYRIHGTNKPNSIGNAASSGCFRMMNKDVEDLYSRVKIGAKVYVQ